MITSLVTPDKVAEILVIPALTAVTSPVEEIVATLVSELVHVTLEVRLSVVLLE